MSHPNTSVIQGLYTALAAKDGAAMGACYADDARFSDPAFQNLDAAGVRTMWAMLCSRATDLTVELSGVEADNTHGKARWVATYTFSKTGRQVRNVINAEFEFRNGLIVRHTDRFDLWRWAGMALGLKGLLLGWTPLVQNAIRKEAMRGLEAFRRKQAS
ncbi:MAG TPA: nuclear transport factor 2 family protein [Accumulibacter sp.]|nr:nuclear transport factor 2 family protein [Accumulibacter sp.]HNI51885.1 nuclear transport factor 2 family protein [Accumulibacter sp.]HNN09288.1 nuclear transport factor 2 family protein [Azospira sp.]HNN46069.1 nuclear transport factor 2 family protein [Azospira sp.]